MRSRILTLKGTRRWRFMSPWLFGIKVPARVVLVVRMELVTVDTVDGVRDASSYEVMEMVGEGLLCLQKGGF